MDDILDYNDGDKEPKRELTKYGKVLYWLEIGFWVASMVLLIFVPYFIILFVPAIVLFYIVAGSAFPFDSGAFKFNYDKIGVLISMLSIPVLVCGLVFKILGMEISSGYFYFNLLVSLGVVIFLLGRLMPGSTNILLKWMDFGEYDELGASHLRYTFVRALIHFFISVSLALSA